MERTKSKKTDSLILEAFKSKGYLVINKTLIKILGLFPAILLSNYIDKYLYFLERFPDNDGWFYLTHEQQIEQLNVGESTIRKYKQLLIKSGILETKMAGVPAKEWLKVNSDTLWSALRKTEVLPSMKRRSLYRYKEPKINSSMVPMKEEEATIFGKVVTLSMFEDFWKLYPRKIDKGKALSAWKKLCNKPSKQKPTWIELKKAILQQAKTDRWRESKFIPHPTTWINQSRWLDDPKEMKTFNNSNETCPIGKQFGLSFNPDLQGCQTCEENFYKTYMLCRAAYKNR